MHFEPGTFYHIYNRSNETVFYTHDNYLFFLKRIKQYIYPNCRILAWVLMPNHFHLLIQASEEGCLKNYEQHRQNLQILAKEFGRLLSSYTQAINRQHNRRGKLFAHDTKAKNLNEEAFDEAFRRSNCLGQNKTDYATSCFLYIHQNPVMAGLVSKPEEW